MSITATETITEASPVATENRWTRPGARWKNVIRPYTKEEVERLRGTVKIEYTLARLGAERLWKLRQEEDYVTDTWSNVGKPGGPASSRRPQSNLSQRVASGSRCQFGRPDVSRPEFVSGEQRSCGGQTDQ
jgi:isocitrate lyase